METTLAPAQAETATQSAPITNEQPQTPPAPESAPIAPNTPAPSSGLDFIPEAYKSASWATKYKTPDDFFKGIENMAKVVGQKQVVQGIQPPPENATEEEINAFYSSLGRPESPDKYELPTDIELPEAFDVDAAKALFTNVAHKNGLTNKQAAAMFKDFMEAEAKEFQEAEAGKVKSFEDAVKMAFPEDPQAGFALAKKGAKAAGIGNTLDSEGLSTNPTVLKLCAELGKFVGEDAVIKGNGAESAQTLQEKALKLQRSPEYMRGDKVVHREVQEIYQRLYPQQG